MEEENKNEEVVASDVNKPIEEVNTSNQPTEDTVTTNEPVVEAAPIVEQPIKRSKKDIIGYNPETGEPIYKEIVPGSEVPKKSKKGLIIGLIIAVIVIIAGVVIAILCLGGKKDDEEQEKELTNREYRQIVADYGKSAEKAIEKYMDKEDEIPSFKDIKDEIKYDDYKVSCNTFKINYDGTVYIAACTVDGKEIKKTISYGEEKEEPVIDEKDNDCYFYKDGDEIKYTLDKEDIKDSKSIVATFDCPEDYNCNPIAQEGFNPGIMSNNKVFLSELSSDRKEYKVVLFDLNNEKVVGTYTSVRWLYKDSDTNHSDKDGEYILVSKSDSNYNGIIDKDGKIIHEYNIGFKKVGGIGSSKFAQTKYSIENDYILDYKDDKYGIVRIKSNDIVIENKYDDIKLVDDKYFKAKENNKWYLYSFTTKEKVLNDGYDYVIAILDKVVVVANEKKIYIKDLEGNDLLDTPIEDTSKEIIEVKEICCANTPGVDAKLNDDGTITIIVYKDNMYNDKKEYSFNPTTKTLSE